MGKKEAEESVSARWNGRTIQLVIIGFEDGRGSSAEEREQPREAGKGQRKDSPLEPPEMNTSLLSPQFYSILDLGPLSAR